MGRISFHVLPQCRFLRPTPPDRSRKVASRPASPDRLFKLPVYRVHGTQLEIIGTFAGGTREGGGILNQGTLRLISSTVSGNTVVQIQGVLTSPPQKGSA